MEMPRCFLLFGSTYRGVIKIQPTSVDNKPLTRGPGGLAQLPRKLTFDNNPSRRAVSGVSTKKRALQEARTFACKGAVLVPRSSSWSRTFDEPIQPPKGKKLVTLKDAAAYILALPKSKQQNPEWQAAIEAVIMAAEDRGPLMHAQVGMMLALHGAKPIPEYDSSKEKHWGRRKLKRDE
jgi:hypothetical protein